MVRISGFTKVLDIFLVLIIAVLVCTSGVYGIPHIGLSGDFFVYSKRGLYLLALMIMLQQEIARERKPFFNCGFEICCVLFLSLLGLNGVLRKEAYAEYGYYAASIVFIFLFVRRFSRDDFRIEILLSSIRVGIALMFVFAAICVLFSIGGDRTTLLLVLSGFNDNRVNFSIWLSQLVFLSFFLTPDKRSIMVPLVISSVFLILQVFTGGRAGVLATLIIMAYFIPKIVSSGYKRLIIATGILILLMASAMYAPTLNVAMEVRGDDASVFRGMPSSTQANVESRKVLDGISAHRLEITLAALKALEPQDFYIGKGVGNSDVMVDGSEWMIHNVWLKTLSELGVLGFLLMALLTVLPYLQKTYCLEKTADLRFAWGITIVIGTLQPRFIIVGLSGCLAMWLCYSLLLREERAVEKVVDEEFGADGSDLKLGYQVNCIKE